MLTLNVTHEDVRKIKEHAEGCKPYLNALKKHQGDNKYIRREFKRLNNLIQECDSTLREGE